jgi:hypothetical protein
MPRLILAFLTVCVFACSAMAAPCIAAKDSCTEWINVGRVDSARMKLDIPGESSTPVYS